MTDLKTLPTGVPFRSRVDVDETVVAAATELFEAGRVLDAYRGAVTSAPLHAWRGGHAQLLGARLARNTGAPRLATLLTLRAVREAPDDHRVLAPALRESARRRGPLAAWCAALRAESRPDLPPNERAEILEVRSGVAAMYRDFDTAWRLWDDAAMIRPPDASSQVLRAMILLDEERRDAALECIDGCLNLRPWYRPAVQFRARLLHLAGEPLEAIAHLTEGLRHVQSHAMAMQLASLKDDVDDHSDFEVLLEQIVTLGPCMEPADHLWLDCLKAKILYRRGDFAGAAAIAQGIPAGIYSDFAERLRQPGAAIRRKRLTLPFVHQKQATCAPATLASVARFWQRDITMDEITEVICYDGTRDYSERAWGEANGFAALEFVVTDESVRQFIDADVPIIVHTVDLESAHCQAIVGYDELRGSFFIHNPAEPHVAEVSATHFLAAQALTGPSGLVLVPKEREAWLRARPGPDTRLCDLNHQFSVALADHDRAGALECLGEMLALAGEHRLVLLGRLSLAAFDGDSIARAEAIDALLQQFQDHPLLLKWKLRELDESGRRPERLRILTDAMRSSGHPAFMRDLGAELALDASQRARAERLMWRAHARSPRDPSIAAALATVVCGPASLDFHRFAAASADKDERFALRWFTSARNEGRTDEALAWLRRRTERYGAKSGGPARTLMRCLGVLHRPEERAVAFEALALRPDDGELLVTAFEMELRAGELDSAEALLERASGRIGPGAWSRSHASLLRRRGQFEAEMAVWRGILDREPLATDAHSAVASSLAATQGQAAVVRHLNEILARFPHHYLLAVLRIRWSDRSDRQSVVGHLEQMLEVHPGDPWALRELALHLHELGRPEPALGAARAGLERDPDDSSIHWALGTILAGAGNVDEAAESFRRAISLDVGEVPAQQGLIRLARTTEEARHALAFIRSELTRQSLIGLGLRAYRDLAFPLIDPESLEADLRSILASRPELWDAWSAVVSQCLDRGAHPDGLALATEARERFPLNSDALRDLCHAQRASGLSHEAIESARRLTTTDPDEESDWRRLAELLEEAGRRADALNVLSEAVDRLPLEDALHQLRAEMTLRAEQREAAWALALESTRRRPEVPWAWDALQRWSRGPDQVAQVLGMLREHTVARPDDFGGWHRLALALPSEDQKEAGAAARRLITLAPTRWEGYDLSAAFLARRGRYKPALAILRDAPFGGRSRPIELEFRWAWVLRIKGDRVAANRHFLEALSTPRESVGGWNCLGEWAFEDDDFDTALFAAQQQMRLSPRAAEPRRKAGVVEMRRGNPEAALEHYRMAVALDPADPEALEALLEGLLVRRELTTVVATAQATPRTGPVNLVARTFLCLATAQLQDDTASMGELTFLASQPGYPAFLADRLTDYFADQTPVRRAGFEGVLSRLASEDCLGPHFARVWVYAESRNGNWATWRKLVAWRRRCGSEIEPAVEMYLDRAAQARRNIPEVRVFMTEEAQWLTERPRLWGQVGYFLISCDEVQACVDWLLPHHRRDDTEGWMLSNLIGSLWMLGRLAESAEVSIFAAARHNGDPALEPHAAHAHADAGRFPEARALLARYAARNLPAANEPWIRYRLAAATALCSVMSGPPGTGRAHLWAFIAEVGRIADAGHRKVLMGGDFESVLKRMKKHSGASTALWAGGRAFPELFGGISTARFVLILAGCVGLIVLGRLIHL